MKLTKRPFEETDWPHLFGWAAADGVPVTKEYVEHNTPYRVVVENGSGPIAMVGWSEWSGVPFVHVVEKPEARSLETWNAVYDLAISTLRECGYQKAVAMVPHGAKIGTAIARKGWTLASDLYVTEL